jgi:hypothetical protein
MFDRIPQPNVCMCMEVRYRVVVKQVDLKPLALFKNREFLRLRCIFIMINVGSTTLLLF